MSLRSQRPNLEQIAKRIAALETQSKTADPIEIELVSYFDRHPQYFKIDPVTRERSSITAAEVPPTSATDNVTVTFGQVRV